MKKTILAAIIIASCFALSTSCQKENVIEQPVTLQTITLTAEGFSTDTKTSVNGNSVSWVNGDVVKLNGSDYAITLSEDHATVEADLSGATAIYGFYPSDIVVSGNETTTTPSVVLPNCYSSVIDGSGNQTIALPMAGYRNKGGNSVNFKHLSAAVNVSIKNETGSTLIVDAVTVSAAQYRLNGTIALDLTAADYGIAPVAATDAADRTVKVTFSTPLEIAKGEIKSVQVPIRPIDNDNLTIEVDSHNADIAGVPVSNLTHKFNHTASSAALGRNVMISAKIRISPQSTNVTSKGTFSVSDTKAVYFSKGNLQATTNNVGVSWTWGFADHQYSFVGGSHSDPLGNDCTPTGNNYVTNQEPWITQNGTVDLFGWVGTDFRSNKITGIAEYGICTDLGASFAPVEFGGRVLMHEWGSLIGQNWFTLSIDEWAYLLSSRGTEGHAACSSLTEEGNSAVARYLKATVVGVSGLIIFPDDFTWPADVEMKSDLVVWKDTAPKLNHSGIQYYRVTFTAEEWGKMEEAGCVFLPAAGYRDNNLVSDFSGVSDPSSKGPKGRYWSSTGSDDNLWYSSSALDIDNENVFYQQSANHGNNNQGKSVRLAYPAN